MCGGPIAISSIRISAGSSPACASPAERVMEGDVSLQLPQAPRLGSRAVARAGGDAAHERVRRRRARRTCARRRAASPAASSTMRAARELFEEITKLDEYYPTRTETALLEAHGEEIAALAGDGPRAGRVRLGLEPQDEPACSARSRRCRAYIPIDIAAESLQEAADVAVRPASGPHHPCRSIADFTATRDAAAACARRKPGSASSPARPSAI